MDEATVIDYNQLFSSSNKTAENCLFPADGIYNKGGYFETPTGKVDCENAGTSSSNDHSPEVSGLLFLAVLFAMVLILALLKFWICERQMDKHRRRAREVRKQQIKEQVIRKKVIEKNQVDRLGMGDCVSSNDNGCSCDVNVSSAPPSFPWAPRDQSNPKKTPSIRRQKTDLEISHHTPNEIKEHDEIECQICLASFKAGDSICWSNNPDCSHVFHMSCLRPWLMTHDECPLCRCQYLMPPKEHPVQVCEVADSRGETTRQSIVRRFVQPFPLPRLPSLHMRNIRRRPEEGRTYHGSSPILGIAIETQGSIAPRIVDGEELHRNGLDDDEPRRSTVRLEEGICVAADTIRDQSGELDIERGVDYTLEQAFET